MRFQVQVEQLDPELLIVCWQSWPNAPHMCSSPVQREGDSDRGQRNKASLRAHDQLLKHDPKNKEERIEQFDRSIKLHSLSKREWRLDGLEQVRQLAARELPEMLAILPHPGNQGPLW